MSNILAISQIIEDETTGANAVYHVIEFYSVDLKYKMINATVNGYVSREKYEQGRTALTSHTLSITGLPEDFSEISLAWLYQQAVSPNADNVFAGAKLLSDTSKPRSKETA